MVRSVVIVASYHQILMRIQIFQPGEDGIAFFKTGISSAVDTKRNRPPFQKGKALGKCFDAGRSVGGFCVISAGKIAEVKDDTAD